MGGEQAATVLSLVEAEKQQTYITNLHTPSPAESV